VIRGGQSSVYSHSPSTGTTSPIHQCRDDPRSLKLDWVARRLFWVEDGEMVSGEGLLERITLQSNY